MVVNNHLNVIGTHQITPTTQSKLPNRREYLVYSLFISLLVLGGIFFWMTTQTLIPDPDYIFLGNMNDFSPELPPELIYLNERRAWIVKTEAEIMILSGYTTHHTTYGYIWSPFNQRFEDPLTGSKFTPTGEFIEGIATRNLDRYEVEIINDELWVNTSKLIPGGDRCNSEWLAPHKDWCLEQYKVQIMSVGYK